MQNRIKKLREQMERLGVSTFLMRVEGVNAPTDHLEYLTDFSGEGALLVKKDKVYFITDSRYEETAKSSLVEVEVFIENNDDLREAGVLGLAAAIKRLGLVAAGEVIGVEGNRLTVDFFRKLQELFPGAEFRLLKNLIDSISERKEDDEIVRIKKALQITEHIFLSHILPKIKLGITEKRIAREISIQGLKHGVDKDAWPPVVASSPNSSMPHYEAGDRILQAGDTLQFDFGYFVNGYCSDFSRVVIVGREPYEKQKEVYNIVLQAQELAIKAIKPGVSGGDIYKIAYDFIKASKYGNFCFEHSLGHGLGIKIHSFPELSPRFDRELQAGHIVTVEPGIYIPGWGGMRLEDMVLVTENGCENLTKAPKNLLRVG